MAFLINANNNKNDNKKIWKGMTIVSMHIRSNKTHLSNVVLQSLQGQVSCFQNLIKLLNSFSELDSLIFWDTIFHIFGPKCHIYWKP